MHDFTVFDGAADAIFVIDEQSRIHYANPAACNLFLISEARIARKSVCFDDLFYNKNRGEVFSLDYLKSIPDVGKSKEVCITLRDGNQLKFLANSKRVANTDGEQWVLYFTQIAAEIRLYGLYKDTAKVKEQALNKLFEYQKNIEVIGLMFVYLVASFAPLSIKYTVQTMPPLLSTSVRLLIAGLLILIFQLIRSRAKVSWRELKYLILIGVFAKGLPMCAISLSLKTVPSGILVLLLGAQPVFTAIWEMFKRGTAGKYALGAVVLGLAGISVLFAGKGDGAQLDWPYLLPLLAALSFAVGNLVAAEKMSPNHVGHEMFIGGVLALGLAFILEDPSAVDPANFSEASKFGLMFGIFFVCVLGFPMAAWLNCAAPLMTSSVAFVKPVLTIVIGLTMGSEPYAHVIVISVLLILAASGLLFKDREQFRGKKHGHDPNSKAPESIAA